MLDSPPSLYGVPDGIRSAGGNPITSSSSAENTNAREGVSCVSPTPLYYVVLCSPPA